MTNIQADSKGDSAVKTAWRDQAIWSKTADNLKAELFKWRLWAAVAGVVGAILETGAATITGLGDAGRRPGAVIALIGAVVLAVVPYVSKFKTSKERYSEWVRARSASEALKEAIYTYFFGAPPYGPNPSPADLIRQCQTIKEKAQDLTLHAASVEPEEKERPLSLTVEEYINKRVNDQIENFYRKKGREKARKAESLRTWEFRLGLAAVALGALASGETASGITGLSIAGPWVAVLTTVSAAFAAYLSASLYHREAIIYFGTADRLTSLRDIWISTGNPADPAKVAKFVEDCEQAISTENKAWLVKWTSVQPSTAAKPPTGP